WESELYERIAAAHAVVLVVTPHWHESKWCFAEFTQARALGKPIFPIVVAPCGDRFVSPDIQQLDLLRDREGGLERLGAGVGGRGGGVVGQGASRARRIPGCSSTSARTRPCTSGATTTSAG